MKMEEVYSNELYKVLGVALGVGESMPLHHATSDAFIICKKGRGKISFENRDELISQGETLLIKGSEPHKMEILEDFSANIILAHDGRIDFGK